MGILPAAIALSLCALGCAPASVPVSSSPSGESKETQGLGQGPYDAKEAWEEYRAKVKAAAVARGDEPDPNPYILDKGAGLLWMRCPVGARWDGRGCEGEPMAMGGLESRQACPKGFRVPTVEEYRLLLGGCDNQAGRVEIGVCRSCERSSRCDRMFGADPGWYWSSDGFLAHAAVQGFWVVSMRYGYIHFAEMGEDRHAALRCVRSKGD